MRLASFVLNDEHMIGLFKDGKVIDIGKTAAKIGIKEKFHSIKTIIRYPDYMDILRLVYDYQNPSMISEEARLIMPIPDPDKVLGVALNYKDFCEKGGIDLPKELKVFGKEKNTISGTGDGVDIQGHSVTYEGELGVVIGRSCRNVMASEAMDYIAGYTIVNDFTANDVVKNDVQLFRGKNFDGFFSSGPVLVTKDEFADDYSFHIMTKVDDEVRQDSYSSNLIFGVPQIIEYFSEFMSLEPGDIIATGTPAGTALQFNPPKFLKQGQKVTITIDGIGTLENYII